MQNLRKALKVLEKMILTETLPAWTGRDREYKMKRDSLDPPKILLARKQDDKTTWLQFYATFSKKGRVISRVEVTAIDSCS